MSFPRLEGMVKRLKKQVEVSREASEKSRESNGIQEGKFYLNWCKPYAIGTEQNIFYEI